MKIIFSRKGFDAKNGGVASPIFDDDRICSLPIPNRTSNVRYKDLKFGRMNLGCIVDDLTRKRAQHYTGNDHALLGPDLRKDASTRRPGWSPSFEQVNTSRILLEKYGIGKGDIFLFFGWFRGVEEAEGQLRFVRGAPDVHLLWGWLQVGEVYQECSQRSRLPRSASFYPLRYEEDDWRADEENYDTLYVARRHLRLPGMRSPLPGGGTFRNYHTQLQLTEPGKTRSIWRLPAWMYPFPNKPPLTYHEKKSRWRKDGRGTILKTVGIGQEFVLDADYYPQAYQWLAELFRGAA